MTQDELSTIFTEALKKKLVGTRELGYEKIVDVQVALSGYWVSGEDYGEGYDVPTYKIQIRCARKSGTITPWIDITP